MSSIIYKKCNKCEKEKLLKEFGKDKSNNDGHQYSCKSCIKKRKQRYYQINKDKIIENQKEYNIKNKIKTKEYYKEYCKINKIVIKEYHKKYHKLNKKKIKEYQKEYTKNKYNTNIDFKLHRIISSTISKMINKKHSTSKYLKKFGYTLEELKIHLENKFQHDMTWDNHSLVGWHIDHIKPKCLFNCDDENELKECWSLSNLQPLWAEDNLKKSNKY